MKRAHAWGAGPGGGGKPMASVQAAAQRARCQARKVCTLIRENVHGTAYMEGFAASLSATHGWLGRLGACPCEEQSGYCWPEQVLATLRLFTHINMNTESSLRHWREYCVNCGSCRRSLGIKRSFPGGLTTLAYNRVSAEKGPEPVPSPGLAASFLTGIIVTAILQQCDPYHCKPAREGHAPSAFLSLPS
eukprot:scaffold117098_cov18-Tisochrysis_lutea.AAC.2